MVRKRTGSAAPDGVVDESTEPDFDPLADEGADDDAPAAPEPEKPVPSGSLKVKMLGQWRKGEGDNAVWMPPGIHIMPREEALHYVKTGSAEVKA